MAGPVSGADDRVGGRMRRSLVSVMLLGGALAGLAAPPIGLRASPPADSVFRMVSLGDGVYTALVVPRPSSYAFSNSLVVVLDDGVLVVDTQQSPSAARALIRRIREITDRPVRWVVNTHWHGDHVYGNQAYRQAFPGVEFLGHPASARALRVKGRERLRQEIETLPTSIAVREVWLERGRGPDGQALTAPDRKALEYSVRMRRSYLGELRGLRLIPPDREVADSMTIRSGTRAVRVLALGSGHTRGDLVVHVPHAGVAAVGDLLEEGLPWVEDADLAEWVTTLDRLEALGARIIVPGHGGIQRGPGLLERQRALFQATLAAARSSKIAGYRGREAEAAAPLPGGLPESLRSVAEEWGVSEAALQAWFRTALTAVRPAAPSIGWSRVGGAGDPGTPPGHRPRGRPPGAG